MPIKSYSIAPSDTAEVFSRKLSANDMKNGALEVYHCLDALRIWDDVFRPMYGELLSLMHRFDGDDPPDVDAVFEHGIVSMEHTCIEPENRRKAQTLISPDQISLVIPAANKVKSAKGILKASNPWGQSVFNDAIAEAYANFNIITNAIRKKMGQCPKGTVIVLESHSGLNDEWMVEPVRIAFELIMREAGCQKYAFVLLARDNPASAFISARRPFEIRRFSPPPMTDAERIDAWRKLTGGEPPEFDQMIEDE